MEVDPTGGLHRQEVSTRQVLEKFAGVEGIVGDTLEKSEHQGVRPQGYPRSGAEGGPKPT